MKKLITLIMVLALAFSFVACTSSGNADQAAAAAPAAATDVATDAAATADAAANVPDEVTIGFVAGLSGDNAQAGQFKKDAVKVIDSELAATNGCITILGKQVKVNIVFEDTESKADICANAYSKCINDLGCIAIVGPDESSMTLAGAPIAQQAGIPVVSTFATNVKVTQVGDYIFRACYIDPFQGKVAATYAFSTLGAKTAGILYSNADPYSTGLMEAFSENFEALGGKVVDVETYAGSDVKDFNAQLSNIYTQQPDVLWMPNQIGELPLQIQQARAMGITSIFMGGDSWDVTTLAETTGIDLVEGAYYVSCFSAESESAAAKQWVEEFTSINGYAPGAHATLAYEAIKIVLNGLQNMTEFSTTNLRDQIVATDIELPSGRVTFDENRNPNKAAVIMQYQGGVGKYITTVQP